ncbi:hypothetical protein D5H75_11680 [Bailinhaonella thermotolerans]|uniref:Uncharacterized protein n=1 Tax=Bailinhaonella thermotolerans TaxID=1070861 RepID=A0A3A4B5W9_9ACTN|nr:hypothetical protein D5H75_11680 [Bailinhaonella thermotolerans]
MIVIAAIVTVLTVGIAAVVYVVIANMNLADDHPGCQVSAPEGTLDLDLEQAQVSATIAAVAARRKLPERAVVIAYATGLQESKLRNLAFGDRDSVGVFQQRPSMGWGSPEKLQDVVYATNKFFAALVKVKGYLKKPLHEAAQAVQKSADGTAYAQHEPDAKILAAAFTGRTAKALRCWFPEEDENGEKPAKRIGEALRELKRAMGSVDASGNRLTVSSERSGWLIASWAVAHAQPYGISGVRHDGVVWLAERGHDGWTSDEREQAQAGIVLN